MKKSFLPLLIFGFLFLCTKPATAQNEQLIKEIRNHILKVDSLIMCRQDTTTTSANWHGHPRGTLWHTICRTTFGFGDLRAMTCEEEFRRATILNHTIYYYRERNAPNRHQKAYFKDGKLVAIVVSWQRWIPSQEGINIDVISRLTVFINNNEIIYSQTEGETRDLRRIKRDIRRTHNFR